MSDDEKNSRVTISSSRRRKKNRQTKFSLVFNEKDRVEFLTGFHKRKDERRKHAHEQNIAKLKEEKRQVKQKKQEEARNRREHERGVPEVDHILEDKEYDMESHTVTVTEIEPISFDTNRLESTNTTTSTGVKPTVKNQKTEVKKISQGKAYKKKKNLAKQSGQNKNSRPGQKRTRGKADRGEKGSEDKSRGFSKRKGRSKRGGPV